MQRSSFESIAVSLVLILLICGGLVLAGPLIVSADGHGSNGHGSHTNTHTETQTQTETQTSTGSSNNLGNMTKESHELVYRMIGTGGNSGQGQANIQIKGTNLKVDLEIEHAAPDTTYSVVLVAIPTPSSGGTHFGTSSVSGTSMASTTATTTTTTTTTCSNAVGMLVTSKVGQGIAHLDTSLNVGTYQIGLLLCIGNNPALISQPATQQGIITAGNVHNDESGLSSDAHHVNAASGDNHVESEIKSAEQNSMVAGVVNAGGLTPTVEQMNQNFAISAGPLYSSGTIISIGTTTVEMPQILIVNLGNSPMFQNVNALAVTMDGAPVQYSPSASQVLSPSNQSAYYSLVQTSHGLQLLISIPHFSDHVIQILPIYTYNWNSIGIAATSTVMIVGVAAFLLEKRKALSLPILHKMNRRTISIADKTKSS